MAFDPSHTCPIERLPPTSWPTINQLAAIGSVVATWCWLEHALESLLATFIQSDVMLTQSLTEDLSVDNRLKAAKRLITTWEWVTGLPSDEHKSLFDELKLLLKWVATNKARRNQIAHRLWVRSDDAEMFGWKHHQAPADIGVRPSATITVTDLLAFSAEIGAIANRLSQAELCARTLPRLPPLSQQTLEVPGLASLLDPYRSRSTP